MKKYSSKDFTFNTCENLSDEQKNALLSKYIELVHDINSITTYPSGRVAEEKKKAVEDKVIAAFKKHPELMYINSYSQLRNTTFCLGRDLLRSNCSEAVKYMLDDDIAPLIQDAHGYNLGMLCALECKEDLAIYALDNPVARKQTSIKGDTIGTLSAQRRMIRATIKALEDEEVSAIQNNDGDNIGMICARMMMGCHDMTPCFELAATNKTAILQHNSARQNMFTIAESSGYNARHLREKFGSLYSEAIREDNLFNLPESFI